MTDDKKPAEPTTKPKPAAESYPMIFVSGGLDSLSGGFAVDATGNWIGRDGEIVKYEGEDMDAAVERMRRR